ncbi:hypothetical protein BFP77_08335 [Maribacter sp. 4U21]|uniref:DUF2586 family protein n=1 Tax=Maribacter sp. 4U21 TaxID=1889779 RepID=UPI000C153F27|nr:DUF2586 family protein [Maribacter sp. 4U21]PIB28915.1 hypothetical protein BFP77_08335 [Maribacter sp. 4U21]
MSLPKVKIIINNDQLGQSAQTADSICGLIVTGVTVAGAGNVTIGNAYKLTSLKDAEAIGIVAAGSNDYPHKQIKDFYSEALTGATLWIMLVASTVTMEDMVDKDLAFGPTLLDAAQGTIRYLGVSRKSAAGITVANGVDEDVDAAAVKAQVLAELYVSKYQNMQVLVDVKDFNGTEADLKDYKTASLNRVSGIICGTGGKNAAVGLFLGRKAATPVQRAAGRVRDGALPITTADLTDDTAIDGKEAVLGNISTKGYIVMYVVPGKSGYFFGKSHTFTEEDDDLNRVEKVAVIDKASLIAASVFSDNILEEIPLEETGKISPAIIGNWKADIERAINLQMTANGEISGVKATIDPDQDILGTSELTVTLQVLPVGYSETITIDLGFTTSLTD